MSSFKWRDNGLSIVFYNSESGKVLAEVSRTLSSQYSVYINESKHGYFIDENSAKQYVEKHFKVDV